MWYDAGFLPDGNKVSIFVLNVNEEIKVLEILKNSGSINFRVMHIDEIPYHALLAQIKDYEKRRLIKHTNDMISITEQGIEYLNQLLSSN
jgi:predicted methyltransferase